MDDRRDISAADSARSPAPEVLVVCPPSHPVAEAVIEQFRDAGCAVHRPASVYEATVDVARDPERFAAVVMAVDFFNREELRFFRLALHRWPGLQTAALAQPNFAHKAAIAELAGADFVCTDPAQAGQLAARLGLTRQALATAADDSMDRNEAAPTTERASVSHLPIARQSASTQPPRTEETDEETETQAVPPPAVPATPATPIARRRKAPAPPPRTPASAKDVLTEEEISALMADMDDEPDPDEMSRHD